MADSVLEREYLEEFKGAFQLVDSSGDGQISAAELREVYSRLGYELPEEQLERMIATVDTDGDGQIDFDEFVSMMTSLTPQADELRVAFNFFDVDGDGSITAEELAQTLQTLGEHVTESDITIMMGDADSDGDGRIDFEEFKKLFRAHGPPKVAGASF
ncbi:MAG: hypothetical protein MHM6MM_002932 [Cercozoa sp. M6MM]